MVSAQGSELCSVWDKQREREWIWQPRQGVWNNSATCLFPVVGRLIHNGWRQNDRFFTLPAHGFLRDQVFSCVHQHDTQLALTASASEETRLIWPWSWRVDSYWELDEQGVQLCFTVQNEDTIPFAYSMGWHPGFNLPISSQPGWQVNFAGKQVVGPLPTQDRTLSIPHPEPGTMAFPLTAECFHRGAVYFGSCRTVCVNNPMGKTVLRLESKNFDWLALWNVPDVDFLCVEPLAGTTDDPDFSGQVDTKRGIRWLEPDESCMFKVSLRFDIDV